MNRRYLILGAMLLFGALVLVLRLRNLEQLGDSNVRNVAPTASKTSVRPDAGNHDHENCHVSHDEKQACGGHPPGPENPRIVALSPQFLEQIVHDSKVEFPLPDGRTVISEAPRIERDAKGVVRISGKISAPESGSVFLQRQDFPGVAGELVGHVVFENSDTAWKVLPEGVGGSPHMR